MFAAEPKAVTNLTAAAVNTTAIQLTWVRQTDHKPSYSYWVEALNNTGVIQNASAQTETYTFSDLTPGKSYTFNVFTVIEGVKSTVATAKSFTRMFSKFLLCQFIYYTLMQA